MSPVPWIVFALACLAVWLDRQQRVSRPTIAICAGVVAVVLSTSSVFVFAAVAFAAIGVYCMWLVATTGEDPPPLAEPEPDRRWEEIEKIAQAEDPWLAIREVRTKYHRERLHVGIGELGWTNTDAQSNCLILGPPRTGKTSAVAVPQIITAFAPVVAVTTKGATLYVPTAQTRARMGQLWHFNPSGEGKTLPGCKELRWSPLAGGKRLEDSATHWHSAERDSSLC